MVLVLLSLLLLLLLLLLYRSTARSIELCIIDSEYPNDRSIRTIPMLSVHNVNETQTVRRQREMMMTMIFSSLRFSHYGEKTQADRRQRLMMMKMRITSAAIIINIGGVLMMMRSKRFLSNCFVVRKIISRSYSCCYHRHRFCFFFFLMLLLQLLPPPLLLFLLLFSTAAAAAVVVYEYRPFSFRKLFSSLLCC